MGSGVEGWCLMGHKGWVSEVSKCKFPLGGSEGGGRRVGAKALRWWWRVEEGRRRMEDLVGVFIGV